MCVQMASLDAALGAFLKRVDALGVPYVVALTADHGSNDAAERAAEHGVSAERIDGNALVKALNAHLEKTLGITYEAIVGDDPQQLTINVPGDDAAFRARLRDTAVAWLKAHKQVAQVFTADEIVAAAPPPGKPADQLSMAERFHESYDPERSGDIIVALAQNASVGVPRAPGDAVAGHGSPWDYDRRVPILFWWPGVAAADRPDPAETVDIAPTLSAIAGIAAPKVDGHCLDAVTDSCTH
jgi:predicted AlkP superfamily pyrophosphatase or phosphodiesterase